MAHSFSVGSSQNSNICHNFEQLEDSEGNGHNLEDSAFEQAPAELLVERELYPIQDDDEDAPLPEGLGDGIPSADHEGTQTSNSPYRPQNYRVRASSGDYKLSRTAPRSRARKRAYARSQHKPQIGARLIIFNDAWRLEY
jgi:hypothetical protein